MSYGLKVLNANLDIQIDSTYINYVLHEHGENIATVNEAWVGSHIVITFSSPTSQPPLIAIKPSSSAYCGLMRYTKSGNNYTGFDVFGDDTVESVIFSWQSFLPSITKSSATYGLRVYDSGEVLVFDSGHVPMIISDVDTANPAYNAVQTITHPSDSNAYYIIAPWGKMDKFYLSGEQFWVDEYIAMIKSLSATQISFGGNRLLMSPGVEVEDIYGFWPSLWTIITVKKAF